MQTQTLNEMGIKNPQEIIGYSLFTVGKNKDVLRINYKRKKGSLLPTSKRFTFPRQSKLVPSEISGKQTLLKEVSPLLNKAVDELDELLKNQQNKSNLKTNLVEEIDNLEAELKSRISVLKAMLKDFK